ncbi:MAG: hypothetical protein EOO30_12565 [Comamonadaceae bacterium]|nr:MAG: hypothetical protein EOO30_12565 [Comamonadaceae bacterium]
MRSFAGWLERLLLVAAAALLAGCAAPMGAVVESLPPVKEQEIVFYRPKDGGGLYFAAVIDGSTVSTSVKAGSVQVFQVQSGSHVVTLKETPAWTGSAVVTANQLRVDVPAGQRRFVRVDLARATIRTYTGNWTFRLHEVPEQEAMQEMRGLRFAF